MLQQIADFKAEAEALYAFLLTLRAEDWSRPTGFKQWTANDIVMHLHDTDLMAAASLAGPEHFAAFRADLNAMVASGLTRMEASRRRLGDLTGVVLRERWYDEMIRLCDALAALPPDARLKWAGPDMGVRMFATARQMETWAHGQALYDLLGVIREPVARLRNIAEIGVRTYGWTFANRGRDVPGPAPYVRLTGPAGSVYEWNVPALDNRVEGDLQAFCQVVTQVRNIADTALTVVGGPATEWMRLAQCFAGKPEDPPAPGSRRVASPGPLP